MPEIPLFWQNYSFKELVPLSRFLTNLGIIHLNNVNDCFKKFSSLVSGDNCAKTLETEFSFGKKTPGFGTESMECCEGQDTGEGGLARNGEEICRLQLSKWLWMGLLLCLPRKVPVILYFFFKERKNIYRSSPVLTFSVLTLKINKAKNPSLVMGLSRNTIFKELFMWAKLFFVWVCLGSFCGTV